MSGIILDDIDFSFDLKEKIFKRIALNIILDTDNSRDIHSIQEEVLTNFEQFEKFLDDTFHDYPIIQKEQSGTEYNSFISAGYIYRTESISRGIFCTLDYHFGINDDKVNVPSIKLTLEIPGNINYWLMENILGSINPVISSKAMSILQRMRSRLDYTKNEQNPKLLLRSFSSSIDESVSNEYGDKHVSEVTGNIDYDLLAKSTELLEKDFGRIVKIIEKRDRGYLPWNQPVVFLKYLLIGAVIAMGIIVIITMFQRLLSN
jgi:hypothetical protein